MYLDIDMVYTDFDETLTKGDSGIPTKKAKKRQLSINTIRKVDETLVREICRIKMAHSQRTKVPICSWEKILKETACRLNAGEEKAIREELENIISSSPKTGAQKEDRTIVADQVESIRHLLEYREKLKNSEKIKIDIERMMQNEQDSFSEQIKIIEKNLKTWPDGDTIISYGAYESSNCDARALEEKISKELGIPMEVTINDLDTEEIGATYKKEKRFYYENVQVWTRYQTTPVITVRKKQKGEK